MKVYFERSMIPIDIPEMKNCRFYSEKIREKDNDQYEALLISIEKKQLFNEIHRRKIRTGIYRVVGTGRFSHHLGITITRKLIRSIDRRRFAGTFLLTQYAAQGITYNEVNSIILQLKSLSASWPLRATKHSWKCFPMVLFSNGKTAIKRHLHSVNQLFRFKQTPPTQRRWSNFNSSRPDEQYPPDTNIYKFVNQLEIVGTEKRIPDGIVYINGLPLVVFEFKSAIREEALFMMLTSSWRFATTEIFPNYLNTMLLRNQRWGKQQSRFILCSVWVFLCLGDVWQVWQKMLTV